MADFLAKVLGAVTVISSIAICIVEPAVLVGLVFIFGVLYVINPKI